MSTIDGMDKERLTRPLSETSGKFYAILGVALVITLAMAVAYAFQLRDGMAITDMRGWGTQGGAPWALYIGAFIWWVGIAHGGIAVSAAVRLFDLETFLPIARIAEVVTLIALPMATLNIMFDIGRPDRMYMVITSWPSTVTSSPLAWDVTAVLLYFTLSATYLAVTLRGDLYELRQRGSLPSVFAPLYSFLLIGYDSNEHGTTDRMAKWLAVAVLLLVPLLSGGVVPWLFATMGMHPGWFGASHGPAMLFESLTSAIAVVLIVAAAFRYGYKWSDVIDDAVFKGLNKALIVLVLATLWFQLQSAVTGSFPAAPTSTAEITSSLLTGAMAPAFWTAIGLLVVALIYLVAQLLQPALFSVAGSVVAALAVTAAIFVKKTVFVVEGLLYPTRAPLANMFPEASYFPTALELTIALGTIGLGAVLMLAATKIIPMVEIEHTGEPEADAEAKAEVTAE